MGVIELLWSCVGLAGLAYLAWTSQSRLGNLWAGLWLRYRPGDLLEFEGISCHLRRITARGAEMCTLEGDLMLVPNDFLARTRVRVRQQGTSVLVKTCVVVGFEHDLGVSRRRLEEALRGHSKARVGVREITPDGVIFELSWWTRPESDPREAIFEVRAALAEVDDGRRWVA